ncbi:hypothetical protein [Streptomyces sviceus]|uniref:hypothetical protein n=1 Tax=Streptomyces sviceus TaxID=285530 RepID=UPI003317ACFE
MGGVRIVGVREADAGVPLASGSARSPMSGPSRDPLDVESAFTLGVALEDGAARFR